MMKAGDMAGETRGDTARAVWPRHGARVGSHRSPILRGGAMMIHQLPVAIKGHHRTRLPADRVNEVVSFVPSTCENCQASLPTEPGPDDPQPRWHQTAELPPFPVVVTEYQAHARICECCGQVTWAQIPAEIAAHCFGPNLAATVSFLSGYCHDSKRNIEQIVQTGVWNESALS